MILKQIGIMEDHSYIYGLTFKCPFVERVPDCPFLKTDHLSVKEKVQWCEKLTRSEKDELLKIHRACSEARENENRHR